MNRLKCLSLFSNVGMAESYFHEIGIDVLLANELLPERAKFYENLYPNTQMICGDITDDTIRKEIINKSIEKGIDFILATPPCQGMSRHGKQDPNDIRNQLIFYAIDVIKKVRPKFVLLENVPKLLTTKIDCNGEKIYIFDYIKKELDEEYDISENVLFNASDYGVPQSRTRCIIRIKLKSMNKIKWQDPIKSRQITMQEAIGDLPSLDPLVREEDMRYKFPDFESKRIEGLKVSKWHYPPTHSWRHIEWMMHTPSGKTAVENKLFYPIKSGERINARLSCYRRYAWIRPANTITQNNGVISSSTCVHPGRKIGKDEFGLDIYSDPRVLTIYELLIVSSLPLDWNIPNWASEKLIRNVIGEGIPPLLVKAIVSPLMDEIKTMENK